MGPVLALEGDDLPVSAFTPGGYMPSATTQFEKRAIAPEVLQHMNMHMDMHMNMNTYMNTYIHMHMNMQRHRPGVAAAPHFLPLNCHSLLLGSCCFSPHPSLPNLSTEQVAPWS